MRIVLLSGFLACVSLHDVTAADAPALQKHLDSLKAIGSEGAGNREAAVAWKSLVGLGVDALIPTLTAMDDAKPTASNWLRLAAQAIVEKEQQGKRALPAEKLEAFLKDAKHAPISRRLAYEFLIEADPKASARLLPGMIEDPSVEIRYDAIAAAIEKATPLIKSDSKSAAVEFEKLFHASRDKGQAETIAKTLKDLNVEVDFNKHFGVLSGWMLIGPFDSTMGAGYPKAYEPESKIDLTAIFKSKDGKDIKWLSHKSVEKYGVVDLNKALGKNMDSVAYAFAVVESEKELPVEIRFGCINAIKVFLNGKEVFAREEYHHGQRFDQYVGIGTLKAGRNEILLKVCQNNQTDSWAQDWKFQVRLCDFTGGALPVKVVTPVRGIPN